MDISESINEFALNAIIRKTPVDPRIPEPGSYIEVDGEQLYVLQCFHVGGQIIVFCEDGNGDKRRVTL